MAIKMENFPPNSYIMVEHFIWTSMKQSIRGQFLKQTDSRYLLY